MASEKENDLLQTAINLAEEHRDVPIVKDILTRKKEDIKVVILKETDSRLVGRIVFGPQSIIIKKLQKGSENKPEAKSSISVEVKGLIQRQKLSPGLTPKLLCWSDKQNALALEDFSSLKLLTEELTSGNIDKPTIHRVAESVAELHKTTFATMQPEIFNQLVQDFPDSPVISSLTNLFNVNPDDLEPGLRKDTIVRLLTNGHIKSTVAYLVETAKKKKQALLHGNLTSDSILVGPEQVKFIKGRYLFVGPCGMDVGRLLAQYLSSYHEHMLTEENNDWHRKISYLMIDAANETVGHYLEAMGDLLKDKEQDFISDVAAYCGLELINRALTSIQSPSKSLEILESGVRLLNSYHRIPHVSRLVVIALMLTF